MPLRPPDGCRMMPMNPDAFPPSTPPCLRWPQTIRRLRAGQAAVAASGLWLLVGLLPAPTRAEPTGRLGMVTEPVGVVETVRKSLSYQPIRAAVAVGAQDLRRIERGVRDNVEQGRFDVNELGDWGELDIQALARATRDYVDAIKLERAAERAEFDVRYRDLVITGADLQRIAESAFVYEPIVRGFSVSRQTVLIPSGGRMVQVTIWVAEVAVQVRFWHIDFETGRAELRYDILGRGGSGRALAAGTRDDAVGAAISALGEDLRTQVRNLADFRLQVNVERATWNGAWFPLTDDDGLVTDTLLRVEELTTDGDRRRLGYLITRRVGDGKVDLQSYAQIITVRDGWRLRGGEMLFEVAQRGYTLGLEPWFASASVTDPSGRNRIADHAGGLRLVGTRRLAEASGIPEFFAVVMAGGGLAGSLLEFGIELGLEKRWNWHRLFAGLGARFGAMRIVAEGEDPLGGGVGGGAWSAGLHGEGTLGLWIVPAFSLEARGGWRAYLPVADLFDGDGLPVTPPGFRYRPSGWQIGLGPSLRF